MKPQQFEVTRRERRFHQLIVNTFSTYNKVVLNCFTGGWAQKFSAFRHRERNESCERMMTEVQRAGDDRRVTGSRGEIEFPAKSQTAALEFRAFRATRLMNYLSSPLPAKAASASALDSVMGINDKREGNCMWTSRANSTSTRNFRRHFAQRFRGRSISVRGNDFTQRPSVRSEMLRMKSRMHSSCGRHKPHNKLWCFPTSRINHKCSHKNYCYVSYTLGWLGSCHIGCEKASCLTSSSFFLFAFWL